MEKSGELSANGHQKAIAWKQHSGTSPGVVFLSGFRSDMLGTKVDHLLNLLSGSGHCFTRFDYRGHGASAGHYVDFTISDWLEDALAVIDQLTTGPLVLVGSSLGGWLSLRVAEARPERIKGLIGIAPAPDFPTRLVLPALNAAQRAQYEAEHVVVDEASGFPEPTCFTRRFIETSVQENIFGRPYRFDGPIRFLQGMADTAVPWQQTAELAQHIESPDIEVVLFKDGDHRLTKTAQLEEMGRQVLHMLQR